MGDVAVIGGVVAGGVGAAKGDGVLGVDPAAEADKVGEEVAVAVGMAPEVDDAEEGEDAFAAA